MIKSVLVTELSEGKEQDEESLSPIRKYCLARCRCIPSLRLAVDLDSRITDVGW